MQSANYTHEQISSFEKALDELKERIIKRGDLPCVSTSKQLEIIDELSSFFAGHF